MATLFLFGSLFAMLFLGMPIAVALGLSSSVAILLFSNDSLASLALKFFQTFDSYTLTSIPFFMLSGAFLTTGGVAQRLIHFANTTVGFVRGGLGIASVFACMLFAAVSGSSPATVVAVGSIAISGMIRSGYDRDFAAGVICNAGTLGILIPPSIPMVVYAATTETSVGRLFSAGLLPGLLLGLMLMAAIYVIARRRNLPAMPRSTLREIVRAGADAFWGILLIFIIMGGIYSGAFTPTEAAAMAAVYAFVVAKFIYGDVPWGAVPKVLVDSGKMTVMLMFIIANAMLFSHALTTEGIPQHISQAMIEFGMKPWSFLLMVNILLLIAGDFMEPSAIILITAPIFLPIARTLGIDPIHLGIIMVVNMEIGMVTPPVGLNLYVTSAITGMSFTQVLKAAAPWMLVLLVFLGIVTYVPILSTLIPNALFGPEIALKQR